MIRRLPVFFLALPAVLLMCSACSGKINQPEKPATTGFECDVDMTYQDMQLGGHLTRESAGALKLDFTSPASLDGISMLWDGETITMKAGALSFGVDPDAVPESALGRCLLDALDTGYRGEENGEITDEGLAISGQSVNGQFEILADPATGHLLSMKIPKLNVTAHFSNFRLIDGGNTPPVSSN